RALPPCARGKRGPLLSAPRPASALPLFAGHSSATRPDAPAHPPTGAHPTPEAPGFGAQGVRPGQPTSDTSPYRPAGAQPGADAAAATPTFGLAGTGQAAS